MDKVTLSVTVLSYNNEQYIEDCLTSIERQGIDSYEVFVIDDCSKDNSAEVVRKFIRNRPQFHLIEKEKNSGGAISSQIGIEKSSGKYCAIVDSDDIVADGAYKALISRIEEDGSDFAAGLPLRLKAGSDFDNLRNEEESNIFGYNRVLETEEERGAFCHQVFYWNCVYRTDFIKSNNIHMPKGLLIADRIFLYDAVYKAKRISIERRIVYYWRQKMNPNKQSIMDIQKEYRAISDRCDSFENQLRVTLENTAELNEDNKLNLYIWENSIKRLFYPLAFLISQRNPDRDYIVQVCERYRLLLCEHSAFFLQLASGGMITPRDAYYIMNIMEGDYKAILQLAVPKGSPVKKESDNPEEETEPKIELRDLPDEMRKPWLFAKEQQLGKEYSFLTIGEEGGRIYLYGQPSNANRRYGMLEIEKVLAITRLYRMKSFELEYDKVRNRVDVTDLPESSYNLIMTGKKSGQPIAIDLKGNRTFPHRIKWENDDILIQSNKFGGNPFMILRKNKYTLLEKNGDTLIKINHRSDENRRIFFYNVEENKKVELEKVSDLLFKIDPARLETGENLLILEKNDGLCSAVYKSQFTNSADQLRKYKNLFFSGRVRIIKSK